MDSENVPSRPSSQVSWGPPPVKPHGPGERKSVPKSTSIVDHRARVSAAQPGSTIADRESTILNLVKSIQDEVRKRAGKFRSLEQQRGRVEKAVIRGLTEGP